MVPIEERHTPSALLPHLFREEFQKMVAVLCGRFGVAHLQTMEDIASDTFATAAEVWPYKGIPVNPTAWLHVVARNKAHNMLQRIAYTKKASTSWQPASTEEMDLSDQFIADSQLRMIFVVCHPALSIESQVALALRVLCGFGLDEIATAFLTSTETIHKRLGRAREKLRKLNVTLEEPSATRMTARLEGVLATLYLLFTEGYYSETRSSIVRESLCAEAMRLAVMLTQQPATHTPAVDALLALMCFHVSRFPARKSPAGELVFYHDQDVSQWDQSLIGRGVSFLHEASRGDVLSRYHLEAAIAYWYTRPADCSGKWQHILHLYDQYLSLYQNPVATVNRLYAFAQVHGNTAAVKAAEGITVWQSPYYHVLMADLLADNDPARAHTHLTTALRTVRNETERIQLEKKRALLGNVSK